jgi:hypothetical protein
MDSCKDADGQCGCISPRFRHLVACLAASISGVARSRFEHGGDTAIHNLVLSGDPASRSICLQWDGFVVGLGDGDDDENNDNTISIQVTQLYVIPFEEAPCPMDRSPEQFEGFIRSITIKEGGVYEIVVEEEDFWSTCKRVMNGEVGSCCLWHYWSTVASFVMNS